MLNKNFQTYYNLEVDKLIREINEKEYKLVLLQFPDGLKYYSKDVVDELRNKTNAEFFVYFGTCFGACDIPFYLEKFGFELCVQWGHVEFVKEKGMW